MRGIRLVFYNKSDDNFSSDVVIFPWGGDASNTVAWTVIENCERGWIHPFVYDPWLEINASDSWGNQTPALPASPGQRFEAVRDWSGDTLKYSHWPSNNPHAIELFNYHDVGAINGHIYNDKRLFMTVRDINPLQTASFEPKPVIGIGIASQVEQGEIMNSALISNMPTHFSLDGIISADIVMTGGGFGPGAKPYVFTLENVVHV